MIFAYLDLLDASLLAFLVFFGAVVTALIAGISFHEFSHAVVADSLGDPTARRMGRVSLNPLAHLDPAGTALLFIAGFGWGKPVQVNVLSLRNGPKAGMATVAAAGPLSNFFIAFLAGLPIQLQWVQWLPPFNDSVINRFINDPSWQASDYFGLYLSSILLLSIIIGVFNLIPLFPLDGHRVVPFFLPDKVAGDYMHFQSRYGFIVLIVLIALPFLFGQQFGLLFDIMGPLINGLVRLLAGTGTNVFG